MSRTLPCGRSSRETPTTRGGKRAKKEQMLASVMPLSSNMGSSRDAATPQREKLRGVRARCDHWHDPVLPLPVPGGELLHRTYLPLGSPGLPGVEVFLHLISIHNSLHHLFVPSLGTRH